MFREAKNNEGILGSWGSLCRDTPPNLVLKQQQALCGVHGVPEPALLCACWAGLDWASHLGCQTYHACTDQLNLQPSLQAFSGW